MKGTHDKTSSMLFSEVKTNFNLKAVQYELCEVAIQFDSQQQGQEEESVDVLEDHTLKNDGETSGKTSFPSIM